MKINNIYSSQIIITKPLITKNNHNKSTHKETNDTKLYNSKSYNYLYPVSFKGSQKTPLTDSDYQQAKKNFKEVYDEAEKKHPNCCIELRMLDLKNLNGLQKGIKVFEGLTMEEIGFVLTHPTFLLNRGCNNNCTHCGFMATPYSQNTLDKMSYEDFISVIDGIAELNERMEDKVSVCPSFGTFYDSDCMNIELTDKDGNIHDYIDCLEQISKISQRPLFDTSGWDPNSSKMQQRAEKIVQYITNPDNKKLIQSFNISINPYHGIYAKSLEAKHSLKFKQAKELEDKYVKRMANVLYTCTPILDSQVEFNFFTRTLNKDAGKLLRLESKIIHQLKKLYMQDLRGEQKYVKSLDEIKKYIKIYSYAITGTEEYGGDILPLGRAESLFRNADNTTADREEETIKYIQTKDPLYLSKGINPNGQVILINSDVSVKTDLELNFENKGKPVKPFAHELQGYVYKSGES